MWKCHYCSGLLSLQVIQKNRLCPTCGSDIHCCMNCTHYDENLSAKCREPDSPWIRDRASQNSCPVFELKPPPKPQTGSQKQGLSEAERAKEAFRALFRTP